MTFSFFLKEVLPEAVALAVFLMVIRRQIRLDKLAKRRADLHRKRQIYKDARRTQDIAWENELRRARAHAAIADVQGLELADILRTGSTGLGREVGDAMLPATVGVPVTRGGAA